VTAADQQSPAVTLVVLAAANTTDPLNDIIGVFEREHPGVTVVPEYAGTQVLATQAQQGAPFDVFVSADRAHTDALAKAGLVADALPLSNGHEVIVVPKDNPAGIGSLRDLADKNAKIVLGVDTVPIGIYTRQVLAKASSDYGADFSARVLAHAVSFETNVKQVLEKVALGEADAGVVYFTDVSPAYKDKVRIIAIPQRYEVTAQNFIAAATHTRYPDFVRDLIAMATGPTGQSIFHQHGYDPMP
jgi:molybdenum ABC transporter molybdate-binding protein